MRSSACKKSVAANQKSRVPQAHSAGFPRSGCGPGVRHENASSPIAAQTKTQNIDERVKRTVCRRSENFPSPVPGCFHFRKGPAVVAEDRECSCRCPGPVASRPRAPKQRRLTWPRKGPSGPANPAGKRFVIIPAILRGATLIAANLFYPLQILRWP